MVCPSNTLPEMMSVSPNAPISPGVKSIAALKVSFAGMETTSDSGRTVRQPVTDTSCGRESSLMMTNDKVDVESMAGRREAHVGVFPRTQLTPSRQGQGPTDSR